MGGMQSGNKVRDLCKEKPMSTIRITEHAYQKAKERLGWNKATLDRMIEKVVQEGHQHKEFSGTMQRWLNKVYLSHKTANNCRIYGEYCYILCGDTLITVYIVPRNLKKYLD